MSIGAHGQEWGEECGHFEEESGQTSQRCCSSRDWEGRGEGDVEKAGISYGMFSRTLWPVGKATGWIQAPAACPELHFLHLYHGCGNSHFTFSWGPILLSLPIPFIKPKPVLSSVEVCLALLSGPTALPRAPVRGGGLGWEGREHLCLIQFVPFCR